MPRPWSPPLFSPLREACLHCRAPPRLTFISFVGWCRPYAHIPGSCPPCAAAAPRPAPHAAAPIAAAPSTAPVCYPCLLTLPADLPDLPPALPNLPATAPHSFCTLTEKGQVLLEHPPVHRLQAAVLV